MVSQVMRGTVWDTECIFPSKAGLTKEVIFEDFHEGGLSKRYCCTHI